MDNRQAAASTDRYNKKKEAIIAAAAGILNRRGVRGMTLADVAASVDLITTSVTYYFKKKEDLAVACYLRGIERFDALIARRSRRAGSAHASAQVPRRLSAAASPHPRGRRGADRGVQRHPRAEGAASADRRPAPMASSSARCARCSARRAYEWLDRRMATARTHMMLEQLYWSVTWLPRYDLDDYARVRDRMFDIMAYRRGADRALRGDRRACPIRPSPTTGRQDQLRETFLTAATRLINQRGYRGASVEKISEQLNVTKGSFYHHNDAKDDLVVECFERTFDVMRRVQTRRAGRARRLLAQDLVRRRDAGRIPAVGTRAAAALLRAQRAARAHASQHGRARQPRVGALRRDDLGRRRAKARSAPSIPTSPPRC